MSSLKSTEGYILIDHRNSPGVPDEIVTKLGLPPGAGKRVFESATFTCSHCERVVIMNPDRSRARGYCPKCNHYVCDECEAKRVASGYECKPFKVMVEEMMNEEAKRPSTSEAYRSSIIIP